MCVSTREVNAKHGSADTRVIPKELVSQCTDALTVYSVLEYLDWSDRIRFWYPLRNHAIFSLVNPVFSEKWAMERLLLESYMVVASDGLITPVSMYYSMRNAIVEGHDDPKNLHLVEKSILLTNVAAEVYCSSSARSTSSQAKGKFRSAGNRISKLEFSLSDHSLSGRNLSGEVVKFFSVGNIVPTIRDVVSERLLAEAVNGSSVCIIVTPGCGYDDMQELILHVRSACKKYNSRRNEQLDEKVYRCDLLESYYQVDRSGVSPVVGENFTRLGKSRTQHLLYEVQFKHYFTKPHKGTHSNRLVICFLADCQRTRRSTNLDLLSIQSCLNALQANSRFIPNRDSKLTKWLDLASMKTIKIVGVVSTSDVAQSVLALRFIERVSIPFG